MNRRGYGSRDRALTAYFESRKDFYLQLVRCSSIEEMRILFDLYAKKLAVQEWLYFMLLVSLNMDSPGRYSNVSEQDSKAAYDMICAELAPGVESYLDTVVTSGVFLKSMFQTILQRSVPVQFVHIFRLIVGKFPDVRRWNHFFKRRRALDEILNAPEKQV